MLFIQGDLMIMGHMLPAAWRCQEFATLSYATDQGRLHVNLTVTMLWDDHEDDDDANDALCQQVAAAAAALCSARGGRLRHSNSPYAQHSSPQTPHWILTTHTAGHKVTIVLPLHW